MAYYFIMLHHFVNLIETLFTHSQTAMIQSFGGRVTTSISGKTNVLLVGKEPGMSKVSKARDKPKIMLADIRDLKEGLDAGLESLEDFDFTQREEPMKIESFSAGYYKGGEYNGLALTAGVKEYAEAQGFKPQKNDEVDELDEDPSKKKKNGTSEVLLLEDQDKKPAAAKKRRKPAKKQAAKVKKEEADDAASDDKDAAEEKPPAKKKRKTAKKKTAKVKEEEENETSPTTTTTSSGGSSTAIVVADKKKKAPKKKATKVKAEQEEDEATSETASPTTTTSSGDSSTAIVVADKKKKPPKKKVPAATKKKKAKTPSPAKNDDDDSSPSGSGEDEEIPDAIACDACGADCSAESWFWPPLEEDYCSYCYELSQVNLVFF